MSANKVTKISENILHHGINMNLVSVEFELSNNLTTKKDILRHPGAVVIIPRLDRDNFILIRQYRFAMEQEILEFPAGTRELHEQPLECAKREIIEETKMQAGTWTNLGTLYPTPGFCDEIQYCYLAENLAPAQLSADFDEIIETIIMTKEQIINAIRNNTLVDAKTIAVFCRAQILGLS